jgi:hypothetical protein
MPMTAAHPLAVLPLRRWRLDTTCLVIGSMSPDFEYFLRVEETSAISHTLLGLVVFCVPITLATAWLFHRWLKWPAVRVAPLRTHLATCGARAWPVQPWWILAASALVGAATHLAWDGITHSDGYGPRHIAFLHEHVHGLVLYRVIQHASTVIGLTVLAIVVVRALRRTPPTAVPPATARTYALWAAAVAVCTALSLARVLALHLHDPGSFVVAIIDGGLGGWLVASVVTR